MKEQGAHGRRAAWIATPSLAVLMGFGLTEVASGWSPQGGAPTQSPGPGSAGPAPVVAPNGEPDEEPDPTGDGSPEGGDESLGPRYGGTIRDGVLEMRARSEQGKHGVALDLADSMLRPTRFLRWRRDLEEGTGGWSERILAPVDPALESLGWNGPPESLRAEVHYAEGQVHALESDLEGAEEALGRAAALAGDGSLRLDALYERGALRLEAAESVRLSIPEVAEELGLAAPPTGPPQPGAAEEEAPDPLDLCRALYLAARDGLLERLRADWRDEDTRANLEWIQRRLRELDEIERKREEQEQEQNQDSNSDDSGAEEPQEQEQDQEQEPGEEPQDGEDEADENSTEDEPEPVEDSPEPQEPEPVEPEPTEEPEAPEESVLPEGARQEEHLTREEVLRLLEQLQEIEEEAEAVRRQLIQNRRAPGKRDW